MGPVCRARANFGLESRSRLVLFRRAEPARPTLGLALEFVILFLLVIILAVFRLLGQQSRVELCGRGEKRTPRSGRRRGGQQLRQLRRAVGKVQQHLHAPPAPPPPERHRAAASGASDDDLGPVTNADASLLTRVAPQQRLQSNDDDDDDPGRHDQD